MTGRKRRRFSAEFKSRVALEAIKAQLEKAIEESLQVKNEDSRFFAWTKLSRKLRYGRVSQGNLRDGSLGTLPFNRVFGPFRTLRYRTLRV